MQIYHLIETHCLLKYDSYTQQDVRFHEPGVKAIKYRLKAIWTPKVLSDKEM